MAEMDNTKSTDDPSVQPADEAQQPVFQLQRCYLKDASLEMPHAPEILMQPQSEQPQVDIQFEVSQRVVAADLVDVTVRGTITVKTGSKVIMTNVLCPSMVYPYLRANLADMMTRANVPPVHLPEVNFEALYQQRLAQAKAEEKTPEATAEA